MKNSIDKYRKSSLLNQVRVWGLIILTLSLTALSVKAQYHFWNGLFGAETAVIASTVFEVLRLASLYALLRWDGYKRVIGITYYLGIALFCGSVAITSWYSEIIEIHSAQNAFLSKEYQYRIEKIKAAFAETMAQKITRVERDLNNVEEKLAMNPKSRYWSNREKQLSQTRSDLSNQMESFLSETPSAPVKWIEKNAARLNLILDPVESKRTEYNAIETAVRSTWHLSTEEAQKFVAMFFVIVVELGIIFLAFMTETGKPDHYPVTNGHSIMTYLEERYNKEDIEMFFKFFAEPMIKHGDLPKASDLTPRLRPIRKAITEYGFQSQEMTDLCRYYLTDHKYLTE
ncbi:hypothetical protein BVY01_03405 [bacterium I07]|nr:hypothetical protein BVY01_03405 [bacterium I07]